MPTLRTGWRAPRGLYLRRMTSASKPTVQAGALRADDVGLHRLEGVALARGHLLQRRGVEHVIDPRHGLRQLVGVADVPDHVAKLRERVAHLPLLFLVAAVDAHLAGALLEELRR